MLDVIKVKLCIVGSFGFKDIGDEAMLTEDLDYIINVIGISRDNIHLFGGDPDYISYFHKHPRGNCLPSSWFQEKKSIRRNTIYRIKRKLKHYIGYFFLYKPCAIFSITKLRKPL